MESALALGQGLRGPFGDAVSPVTLGMPKNYVEENAVNDDGYFTGGGGAATHAASGQSATRAAPLTPLSTLPAPANPASRLAVAHRYRLSPPRARRQSPMSDYYNKRPVVR